MMINTRERYRGSLLGLAIGDALGAPLEFKAPGTVEGGIPADWIKRVAHRDLIMGFAEKLFFTRGDT